MIGMKEKIVTVSGGFDPVHIGHIRMIREASKLGKLIVILNNDAFLIRKKGRAFMPLEERKEILENIKGVDSVFISIDEDDSVCKSLEAIKPDIFANGGDRKDESEIREADVCKRLGIEMVFNVGGGKIQSSSWLIESRDRDKK
jgi:cytidyltransferase-like protein